MYFQITGDRSGELLDSAAPQRFVKGVFFPRQSYSMHNLGTGRKLP